MDARTRRWAPGLAACLMLVATAATAKPVRVEGGSITYHVDHRLKAFEGTIPASAATLDLDWSGGDLAGLQFTAVIPLAGLDSGNQLRDEHALEALEEFLFPEARWVVEKVGVQRLEPQKGEWTSATLEVSGPLTLHGITEVLTVEVQVTRSGDIASLEARFPLSLTAYGIGRPGLLGFKIDDTVTVTVALQAPAP